MVESGTRLARTRLRKRRAGRLLRLHALAAGLSLLALCLPGALGSPGRADEAALAAGALWLSVGLWPGRRDGVLRIAVAVAAILAGVGLYWGALALPLPAPAGPAGPTGTAGGSARPHRATVVVTGADDPYFLARVVGVKADLTLVVEAGPGLSRSELALVGVSGVSGASGVSGVSGNQTPPGPPIHLSEALRYLEAEALGREVTVRVPDQMALDQVALYGPDRSQVAVYVYLGTADPAGLSSQPTLNSRVVDILGGPAPADGPDGTGEP